MPPAIPDRAEVEARWAGIAQGTADREETHEWAEPRMVLGERSDDLMVMTRPSVRPWLRHDLPLRGGDLVGHGPPGAYVRSAEDVADELQRWRDKCIDYDADPVG